MRLLVTVLAFVAFLSSSAFAQRSDSIAAVVNDDVITFTDLYDRINLVIKSSGMPNKREFKQRLLPQVLTGLITETIQIQEAEKLGLETSKDEIATGFSRIAEQNKMKPEQFKGILKKQGIKVSTLDRQILAQLAWAKVVQSEIRPLVQLNDSDIEAEIKRLKAKEGQKEYSIAEIFLPIDEKNGERKTREIANDLSRQLSKDVQKFPAAARQFSQNASAANGGIIGWVTPDQMTPELGLAIKNLKPRQISQPIKGENGYTLLFIRDTRVIDLGDTEKKEERLRIKLAIFTLSEDDQAVREARQKEAEDFARDVKGCLDIVKQTAKNENARLDNIEDTLPHIPEDIMKAVKPLAIGDAAQPIVKDKEIIVPMLCGRDGNGNAVTQLEKDMENRIGTQRMDILQKRHLRDLISNAYIERRV